MKKKMTMALMALAVSAMTTSAFAAEPVAQTKTIPAQATLKLQSVKAPQAVSFREFVKVQGITADELLAQMEKDGSLAHLAKLKTLSLDEMKDYLQEKGKVVEAFATFPVQTVDIKDSGAKEGAAEGKTTAAMTIVKLGDAGKDGDKAKADEAGVAVPFAKVVTIPALATTPAAESDGKAVELKSADDKTMMVKMTRVIPAVKMDGAAEPTAEMATIVAAGKVDLTKMAAVTVSLSFAEVAKNQGLSIDELIAKMEEDGTLSAIAKSKNMTEEEAIDYLKNDAAYAEAAVMIPAKQNK